MALETGPIAAGIGGYGKSTGAYAAQGLSELHRALCIGVYAKSGRALSIGV